MEQMFELSEEQILGLIQALKSEDSFVKSMAISFLNHTLESPPSPD